MTCRHFNGCLTRKLCKAGVEYKAVAKDPDDVGWVYRLPCLPVSGYHHERMTINGRGTCDKFEPIHETE